MVRLIPAGAGKTWGEKNTPHHPSAHPRWCGENNLDEEELKVTRGSSPLVRGKLFIWTSHGCFSGLIPAGAGKTLIKLHV